MFIKILLFVVILYFLYSWTKDAFIPNRKEKKKQPGVRIFKKGKIEESQMDMSDAETIDFEEIKESKDVTD